MYQIEIYNLLDKTTREIRMPMPDEHEPLSAAMFRSGDVWNCRDERGVSPADRSLVVGDFMPADHSAPFPGEAHPASCDWVYGPWTATMPKLGEIIVNLGPSLPYGLRGIVTDIESHHVPFEDSQALATATLLVRWANGMLADIDMQAVALLAEHCRFCGIRRPVTEERSGITSTVNSRGGL